jgi:hypothetical protein
MELKLSWFGRFSGSVEDDAAKGVPGTGTVKGRVFGDQVEFNKWIPVFYVASGHCLVTLREYLAGQSGLVLDSDLRPPPIYYHGQYNTTEDQVTGQWEIQSALLRFTSRGQTYTLEVPTVTGTWEMTRARE